MDSDIFKIGLCAGLAVVCFTAPEWVSAWADAARAAEECCVQPEDEWCSGATPDYPSHYEAWNSLPPTVH